MSFRVLIYCLLVSIALVAAPVAGQTPPGSPKLPDGESIRGEVARLLQRLDSNEFAVRQQAAAGLEALAARPELGGLLAAEFDRELSRLDISFEVRWNLQRWADRLPQVAPEQTEASSPQQIDALIDRLSDDSYSVRVGAARGLQRLLMQDEHLTYLKQALPSRLTDRLDPGAAVEIRKLLDLTRPAMVAEYWRGGHHEGEQHLYVGVPSQTEGAPRPSHFDRIDDRTAHCVSGSNLLPGDYPVGVAFPHPNQDGAFFQLVNLPTPRRRLEYDRYVKTDEAARLAAISRRTVDRLLQEPRDLTESELMMLGQFDGGEVSRFAGRYFLLVDDKPLPDSEGRRGVGRASRFGLICRCWRPRERKTPCRGCWRRCGKTASCRPLPRRPIGCTGWPRCRSPRATPGRRQTRGPTPTRGSSA